MSDVNDFFAKKDKKKLAAKAAKAKADVEPVTVKVDAPVEDSGWLDAESRKVAQVNTGGRSVVALNKDEIAEREAKPQESADAAFKGWKTDEPIAEPVPAAPPGQTKYTPPGQTKYTPPALTAKTNFPSLAEASTIPKAPAAINTTASATSTAYPFSAGSRHGGVPPSLQGGPVATKNRFAGLAAAMQKLNTENTHVPAPGATKDSTAEARSSDMKDDENGTKSPQAATNGE